jgi:hypothetical protein
MPFFKSFWRETGKNTGKWASNKVFGDAWSTPYRIQRSHQRAQQKAQDTIADVETGRIRREREIERNEEKQRLLAEVNAIQFHSDDSRVIATQLDELLTLQRYAKEKNYGISRIVDSRIRAGIMWLRRSGETELADFYKKELFNATYLTLFKGGFKIIAFFLFVCAIPMFTLMYYKYVFKFIVWIFN